MSYMLRVSLYKVSCNFLAASLDLNFARIRREPFFKVEVGIVGNPFSKVF